MGHLVVMDDSEAQFALTAYSLRLWRELFSEFGPFAEIEHRGTLWIAADDDEMSAVSQKAVFYSSRGVRADVLDARATAEAEPRLARLAGSLLVQDDAVVYPPVAARKFIDIAVRHGARLLTGWKADAISEGIARGAAGTVQARWVINATGIHSHRLSPQVTLRPRRGHLAITDRYPGLVQHQIVELGYLKSAHEMSGESVAFNLQPRSTGQLLLGSSRELGADDTGINRRVLANMIGRAARYMPTLEQLSVTRVWTGLRPTTPDKLPLIGQLSGDGVWIAAGHEGLGITTAPATGRIIADLILEKKPEIDPAPFNPQRASAAWNPAS
jgi:glycine/D-amino acid oxidase-like deaminating enzyme